MTVSDISDTPVTVNIHLRSLLVWNLAQIRQYKNYYNNNNACVFIDCLLDHIHS